MHFGDLGLDVILTLGLGWVFEDFGRMLDLGAVMACEAKFKECKQLWDFLAPNVVVSRLWLVKKDSV